MNSETTDDEKSSVTTELESFPPSSSRQRKSTSAPEEWEELSRRFHSDLEKRRICRRSCTSERNTYT